MIALLQPDTVEILNRLMAIHCTSFPQYMAYARPYVPLGKELILETLRQIGDDQTRMADRISDLVRSAHSAVETGDFPMEFTDTHDLGISRILDMALVYQVEDIRSIAECAEQLRLAPAAHALAEEALGMAKGHLELLQELDHD